MSPGTDQPEEKTLKNKSSEGIRHLFRSDLTRAALILAAVLVIFYRDVFFGGKTFLMENSTLGVMPASQGGGPYGFPRQSSEFAPSPVKDAGAIAWGYEPSMKLARDLLRQGQLPLWKDNPGLGSPLLADGMSLPMEPLLVLTYLMPEKWWPWVTDGLVLLRYFLAGWFTYLFARQIGVRFLPALLGGTAYMLSYQMVIFGDNPQLPVLVLMPLMLYAFGRLADQPSFKLSVGTALVIAWVICAGLPEASFLVLVMGGLWFLYRAFWQLKVAGFTWQAWRRWAGWGTTTVLSGVALSAWFWLPLVENLLQSVNNHPAGRGLTTLRPIRLILAILPPIEPMTFFPTFGIVVMTLAIVAVITMRRSSEAAHPGAFFLGYTLVFGLEMYGVPPFKWIGYIPGYSQMNIPHYLVPSLTLSLIILGMLGLETILDSSRPLVPLLLACIFQAGVITYFVGFAHLPFEYSRPVMIVNIAITVVVLLSMCTIVLALSTFRRKNAIPVFFLFLLLAEMIVIHRHTERPVRYDPFTEPPFATYLKARQATFRIMAFDGILNPNIAMAFGIDDLRYLDAIEPERRHAFMQALIAPDKYIDRITGFESPFLTGRVLNLLNIRYLLAPNDYALSDGSRLSDHYNLVYNDEIQIYENTQALPRAYLIYQAEQVENLESALDRLNDPNFDIYSTAAVEKAFWAPELQDLPTFQAEQWTPVEITARTANSMEIKTESASPGILVISETYFPGWKGYLDGQAATIFPVDGLLRGIFVPAGSHLVRLSYRPLSFSIGAGISLTLGFALVAAGLISMRRKNSIY
jgi:hypothetical protein